jgi:hypothetical protein
MREVVTTTAQRTLLTGRSLRTELRENLSALRYQREELHQECQHKVDVQSLDSKLEKDESDERRKPLRRDE